MESEKQTAYFSRSDVNQFTHANHFRYTDLLIIGNSGTTGVKSYFTNICCVNELCHDHAEGPKSSLPLICTPPYSLINLLLTFITCLSPPHLPSPDCLSPPPFLPLHDLLCPPSLSCLSFSPSLSCFLNSFLLPPCSNLLPISHNLISEDYSFTCAE